MNALSYFAPSFFLFTVHIAMEAFRDDVFTKVLANIIVDPNHSEFYNAFVYTMDFFYTLLTASIIFYSLHLPSSHSKFKPLIYSVSTIYGLFMVIVFAVLLVDIIRGLISSSDCTHLSIQSSSRTKPWSKTCREASTPLTTCVGSSLAQWPSTQCPSASTLYFSGE